jgi:hypothetical protein
MTLNEDNTFRRKEKAPALSGQGFFFVDKRIEISNLQKDMTEIIKLTRV